MTEDVAVVGLGIHAVRAPSRASPGSRWRAHAARAALADAGIGWEQVDFAAGGSDSAGNADTTVSVLGLTGVPFINVKNGCATGGSALTTAHAMLSAGSAEIAARGRVRQASAGRVQPAARGVGDRLLVRRDRADAHDAVLRDEDPALHGRARDQRVDAREGRRQGVRERQPQPERLAPAGRCRRQEVLASRMVNDPLRQYMFCSPGRGRGRARAGAGRADPRAHVEARATCAPWRSGHAASAPSRSSARPIPVETAPSPTAEAAAAAFEQAGIGPEDVDVAQLQDTESGAEIMHLAETGLCQDGEQEALIQSGATRIGGRLPVNTDGGCLACGEPIGASGLRQVHEVALQLRGEAGDRADPGAGAGRIHPGLRGPRSERVHRPEHLSGPLARSRRLVLPELLARGAARTRAAGDGVRRRSSARTPSCTTAPRAWRRRSPPPACGRATASRCCCTTGFEFAEALLACHRIGACAVPINFRLTADEIAYILEDSGAAALIAGGRPDGLARLPVELETGPAYEAAIARLRAGGAGRSPRGRPRAALLHVGHDRTARRARSSATPTSWRRR